MSRVLQPMMDWPTDGLEFREICPVCGSGAKKLLYRGIFDRINNAPGRWNLYECLNCGSGFIDPRPDRESIGLAYENYYTHQVDEQRENSFGKPGYAVSLRNGYLNSVYKTTLKPETRVGAFLLHYIPFLRERAEHLMRHLPPTNGVNSRLLDVGCGNGSFLSRMAKLGWNVHGIEPDLNAAKAAKGLGISVLHGSLDTLALDDLGRFDAITMCHVIEHLHDPLAALLKCKKLLRKGGVISIITPNFSSLGRRIYKEDWYPLQPPCHLALFTAKSLVQTLRRAGYQGVRAHSSFYGFRSIHDASRNLSPSLREKSKFERLLTSSPLGYISCASTRLSEEAIVTAYA